jgi:prephenate dehydratase
LTSHPTVAIQGQAASFHDVAARKYFGDDITTVFCDLPFRLVFDALESGRADYAVCAIENSLHGTINEVYDLLQARRPYISGEIYLHIEQCLIGLPGATLADITEVYSHPVALSQCEDFLDSTLAHATRFEHPDTAGSVADVAASGDKHKAAIGPAAAATLHGMQVLQRGIETNHENYTRFFVMTREKIDQADSDKTSIVIEAPNQVGALHQALGAFADEGLNLSLLTSRPIIGKPQTYTFYLDFAGGVTEDRSRRALAELEKMGCTVTILGSYKAATMPGL